MGQHQAQEGCGRQTALPAGVAVAVGRIGVFVAVGVAGAKVAVGVFVLAGSGAALGVAVTVLAAVGSGVDVAVGIAAPASTSDTESIQKESLLSPYRRKRRRPSLTVPLKPRVLNSKV